MRPDVDRSQRAERRADPVDDKVLHGRVAAAAKLERGGQHRVEVAAAGREGQAHHAGGDEAVDGGGILGLLLGDEPRAEATDEGGRALDNGAVEDGDSEVGRADVVDGGVGAALVGLSNL